MKKSLTSSEEQVYSFILEYTVNHLFPPTVSEIRDGTKIKSNSTIFEILKRLEERKLIEITKHTPRGIKLIGYSIMRTDEDRQGQGGNA